MGFNSGFKGLISWSNIMNKNLQNPVNDAQWPGKYLVAGKHIPPLQPIECEWRYPT